MPQTPKLTPEQLRLLDLICPDSVNHGIDYTTDSSDEPVFERFFNSLPEWHRKIAPSGVTKKILVITDRTAKYCVDNEKLAKLFDNCLWRALFEQGFVVYVWQGKLVRIKSLEELLFSIELIQPVKDDVIVQEFNKNNDGSDKIKILDYFETRNLLVKARNFVTELQPLFENGTFEPYENFLDLSIFEYYSEDDFVQLIDSLNHARSIQLATGLTVYSNLFKFIKIVFSQFKEISALHLRIFPGPSFDSKDISIDETFYKNYIQLLKENAYDSSKVEHLYFSLLPSDINLVCTIIQYHTQIKTLSLYGGRISSLQALYNLPQLRNLETLVLQSNDDYSSDNCALFFWLAPRAKRLILNNYKATQDDINLFNVINFRQVEHLALKGCNFNDLEKKTLFDNCPRLLTLRLEQCRNINGLFSANIQKPLITEICLERCELGTYDLSEAFFAGLQGLQKLTLKNCSNISRNHLIVLLQCGHPSLIHLEIIDCNFVGESLTKEGANEQNPKNRANLIDAKAHQQISSRRSFDQLLTLTLDLQELCFNLSSLAPASRLQKMILKNGKEASKNGELVLGNDTKSIVDLDRIAATNLAQTYLTFVSLRGFRLVDPTFCQFVETLEISDCTDLDKIFSSQSIMQFHKLLNLTIKNAPVNTPTLECISVQCPHLTSLTLENCQNNSSINCDLSHLKFSALKQLTLDNCSHENSNFWYFFIYRTPNIKLLKLVNLQEQIIRVLWMALRHSGSAGNSNHLCSSLEKLHIDCSDASLLKYFERYTEGTDNYNPSLCVHPLKELIIEGYKRDILLNIAALLCDFPFLTRINVSNQIRCCFNLGERTHFPTQWTHLRELEFNGLLNNSDFTALITQCPELSRETINKIVRKQEASANSNSKVVTLLNSYRPSVGDYILGAGFTLFNGAKNLLAGGPEQNLPYWQRNTHYLTADTQQQQTLAAVEYFLPKANNYPHPADYRLNVYKKVTVNNGIIMLTEKPAKIRRLSPEEHDRIIKTNVRALYATKYEQHPTHFFGNIETSISHGWMRLPGLTDDDELVSCEVTTTIRTNHTTIKKVVVAIQLIHDDENDWHIIQWDRNQKITATTISVAFIIQAQRKNTTHNILNLRHLISQLRFSDTGDIIAECRSVFEILKALDPEKRLACLVHFGHQFQSGTLPGHYQPSSIPLLNALLRTPIGSCDERSFVTTFLADKLNISSAYVGNDIHAQLGAQLYGEKVYLRFRWISGELNIVRMPQQIRGSVSAANSNTLDNHQTALQVYPAQTRKYFTVQALTLPPIHQSEDYFYWIFSTIATLPEHQRNCRIVFANEADIEAFNALLMQFLEMRRQQHFYVDNLGQICRTDIKVDSNGKQLISGSFIQYLNSARCNDVLAIKWVKHQSHYIGHYSMMEDDRYFETTAIKPGVIL